MLRHSVTNVYITAAVQEAPAGPAAPAGQAALARAATTAGPARATAKSEEVYANNALREKRVWPNDEPENPYTQVIFWRKAPYARLRKNGWMRIYGMQSGRNGKVELIMEARGGNQYTLEVPLRQVQSCLNGQVMRFKTWFDPHMSPCRPCQSEFASLNCYGRHMCCLPYRTKAQEVANQSSLTYSGIARFLFSLLLAGTAAGEAMGYAVHECPVQQLDRLGFASEALCWQDQE